MRTHRGPRYDEAGRPQDGRGRPRVLYLTHHLPWPPYSGGRLRESQLISRLTDRFDIRVVAITKDIDGDRGAMAQAASLGVLARLFPAKPQWRLSGPHVRAHGSPQARRYLRQCRTAEYDVIHVEGHYLMPLLPRAVRRRAVLVEHNVESTLFAQAARLCTATTYRARTYAQSALTGLDERRAWRRARVVVGVTSEDVDTIATIVGHGRVHLVPNGADHLSCASTGSSRPAGSRPPSLVFVGNFAYSPNADAARELINTILPRVRALVGAVSLTLVGSGPPPWLRDATAAGEAINVTGPVPDVAPWLQAATVVVAPLRIGGGVKVKLLEALAMGKSVVTTSIGAQGMRDLPSGSFIQAGDSAEFAAAVARLLASETARRRQETLARAAARLLPTWDIAAERLAACWNGTR